MTGFEVYLWLHLIPALGITFIVLGSIAVCVVTWVVLAGCFGNVGGGIWSKTWSCKENKEKAKKWWKAIPLACLILIIGVACPSRKTVVLCYIIPAVANSQIMEELPEDLHHIYSEGMDRLIELVEGNSK